MDQHPEVVILNEAAGSLSCIRKITELGRDADIIASADYRLINELLMPAYCSWNIRFASNEMVIAFNDKSAKGDEIDSTNFFNILAEDEITYGRSNPNSDPCGYRTVLCLKLAASYFNNNEILDLLQKDNELIRPKETDLIALLETGNIDYMFIYRSVAQQHGLRYIILPDAINLKKAELSDWYARVKVETAGKAPGETMTQRGEPMVYGISILDKAPGKGQAIDFLDFFMDNDKGLKILDSLGQPPFIPAPADGYEMLPPKLKKYCTKLD
jgi:molybdate/tungstate transport system substrate-binding protein